MGSLDCRKSLSNHDFNKTKAVVFAFVLVLASFFVAIWNSSNGQQIVLPGVPIKDSPFSDLIGSPFPTGYDLRNLTSISVDERWRIDFHWSPSDIILTEEVRMAAINFITRNFDGIDDCVLSPSLMSSFPAYRITGIINDMTFTMMVNAFSGRVIHFLLREESFISLNYQNETISPSDAEAAAFNFLENNNYSIPSNARYLGVIRPFGRNSSLSDYMIAFQHIAGEIPVYDNPSLENTIFDEGIRIIVDKSNGAIEGFHYEWFEISPPSSGPYVSKNDAIGIALDVYGDSRNVKSSNLSIVKSESFTYINNQTEIIRGFSFYLAWTVVFEGGGRYELIIDALNGVVLGERRYRGILVNLAVNS